MTADEVEALGDVTLERGILEEGWGRSGCRLVMLERKSSPLTDRVGILSLSQGLESLDARDGDVTPQGVGLGSTIEVVSAAFSRPDLAAGDYFTTPAAPGAVYEVGMSVEGIVQFLRLRLRSIDCPGP